MKAFSLAVLSLCLLLNSGAHAQTAGLRVIHLSPDAPAVDVLVNGAAVLEGLPYLGYTPYLPLPAGQYGVQVNLAGTQTTVLRANLTLRAGVDYTVFAGGFASGDREPRLQLVVAEDDNAIGDRTRTRIRAIHGAPSAPKVDIYATSPWAALSTATPAAPNRGWGEVTPTLTVPAGAYQARVTLAGTKTVAIQSGSLQLEGGTVYTIVAVENPGSGDRSFSFLVIPDRR
ncbi:MAG: DUF4397 domain-containing protein [Bryobacteraceae bacterium]|nr:DUF4397 domain-containing protein [Bryobacteraceae bacterium]